MAEDNKLQILSISDFNLIANKDPEGSYDRKTRENLYHIIEKLRSNYDRLCALEHRVYQKFQLARFSALEEKEKQVRLEVARYRLNAGFKRSAEITAATVLIVLLVGWTFYQYVLDTETRNRVDVVFYAGMNKVGLVSADEFEGIRRNLNLASAELQRARKNNEELSRTVEQMVLNNQVTENLGYILRHIYNDPSTRYLETKTEMVLAFEKQEIVRYRTDPALWYLLGIIDTGVIRVFYNNEEILEIDSIFGRVGEETPVGDYQIVNKVHEPTWYKKERKNGETRVRAIPFGSPDHEIGTWWMGLKKSGDLAPGSYGIHGVNVSKVNDFYKKQFDWRSGSAGCPNVQAWNLHFLAKMVPAGTRVRKRPTIGRLKTHAGFKQENNNREKTLEWKVQTVHRPVDGTIQRFDRVRQALVRLRHRGQHRPLQNAGEM
jgi:hypothetical protein